MARGPAGALRSVVQITTAWEPCHLDDIRPILNPAQRCDLEDVLAKTMPVRRMRVAMAFADVPDMVELIVMAGLAPSRALHGGLGVSFHRWLVARSTRLPMGIGFRLARVFGVPAELLCEGYV